MGLFANTLRDANRPLVGSWVRRSSAPMEPEWEKELAPETGMQTLFRFQKGVAPAPTAGAAQVASPRPAAAASKAGAVPAADPLSVRSEVHTPRSISQDVNGNEDMAPFYVEHEQPSKLETGQASNASPEQAATVPAEPESGFPRSALASEDPEAGPIREVHAHVVMASSAQPVSKEARNPGRWSPGRGAPPSEISSIGAPEGRATALPRRAGAQPGIERAETGPRGPEAGQQRRPESAAPVHDRVRPAAHETAAPATPSASALVIGRIDVVVLADAGSRRPAPATTDGNHLSRGYLRRL